MLVRIGLENGIEGRSLAWALDHPGCFAYGLDGQSAIVAMAQAVPDYIQWMERRTEKPWFNPVEIDLRLVETWEVYQINGTYQRVKEGYEVNAWFLNDWIPISEDDVEKGLRLLEWQRQDLIDLVSGIDEIFMKRQVGEDWPVERVLRHIGLADWWYLSRLGLAPIPRDALPPDPLDRMSLTRRYLAEILPRLVGEDRVMGKDGEFWSPRKLLRRAVWHERDHTQHIQRLLG